MCKSKSLIKKLWSFYCQKVPSAQKIQKALIGQGEIWVEDHIALRTFNWRKFGKQNLENYFSSLGWQTIETGYVFPEKHLTALHMAHSDRDLPKIFISQLEVQQLSKQSQQIIDKYLKNLDEPLMASADLDEAVNCFRNPVWGLVQFEDYQKLLIESQYAGWTLLFGNNVNHFTISVHLMKRLNDMLKINAMVESLGIRLNSDHGKIKGSPQVYLEQSSTMADVISVPFLDGETHTVPYAFIEFARRYPLKDDAELWDDYFQGFVEGNADRIFTSTNI